MNAHARSDAAFIAPSPIILLRRIASLFAEWRERAASRQVLAVLSDRELRDIGVSPGEAIA